MAADLDAVLARIRGEFLEMPGLHLTASQAQRLWNLPSDACQLALDRRGISPANR